MHKARLARILFVTGTDTAVGKTVVTGLLLAHLRQQGVNALAVKPFCSGGRGDVLLLSALQDDALPAGLLNPCSYAAAVAPMVAARLEHKPAKLAQVARSIRSAGRRCEVLLVEGAGGLLVPLTEEASVLDLIKTLSCEVVVAAANQLGTINHTLLTLSVLRQAGVRRIKVALIDTRRGDASVATNAEVLAEKLGCVPLVRIPYLGPGCSRPGKIREAAPTLAGELAVLAG